MRQHICLEQALVTFVSIVIRLPSMMTNTPSLIIYEDDNYDKIQAVFAIAYCPFCGQKLVEGE